MHFIFNVASANINQIIFAKWGRLTTTPSVPETTFRGKLNFKFRQI